MEKLYARAVFFAHDTEASMRHYIDQLGFALDWHFEEEGRTTVCQVSLFGFEIILNEVGEKTRDRPGHGRVFIGVEDHQGDPVRNHLVAQHVPMERVDWGRPTLVVKDLDGNELFFWLPHDDWTGLTFVSSAG